MLPHRRQTSTIRDLENYSVPGLKEYGLDSMPVDSIQSVLQLDIEQVDAYGSDSYDPGSNLEAEFDSDTSDHEEVIPQQRGLQEERLSEDHVVRQHLVILGE